MRPRTFHSNLSASISSVAFVLAFYLGGYYGLVMNPVLGLYAFCSLFFYARQQQLCRFEGMSAVNACVVAVFSLCLLWNMFFIYYVQDLSYLSAVVGSELVATPLIFFIGLSPLALYSVHELQLRGRLPHIKLEGMSKTESISRNTAIVLFACFFAAIMVYPSTMINNPWQKDNTSYELPSVCISCHEDGLDMSCADLGEIQLTLGNIQGVLSVMCLFSPSSACMIAGNSSGKHRVYRETFVLQSLQNDIAASTSAYTPFLTYRSDSEHLDCGDIELFSHIDGFAELEPGNYTGRHVRHVQMNAALTAEEVNCYFQDPNASTYTLLGNIVTRLAYFGGLMVTTLGVFKYFLTHIEPGISRS
eukprot:CAMPEP_0182488954 /NCGR_PEP_ID=MMETSP1319-20130603/48664_1 /TAXON_ID=172717 /ORGANISM="Bolidomonas pacifica, Strain RCC208" /LENGTH=360 /DNA_ID=CAMNT_0024691079 /DNA_START=951 /DNA_END=2029 /DNA_ORIENTATION=+